MNLDKKLELAHEFVMKHGKADTIGDRDSAVKHAWQYADAMEAEYNKRKTTGLPEALQDEFQPDWSVAPDDAVAWVYSNIDRSGFWCHKPPVRLSRGWCTSTMSNKAPSFNYQGDWKDSLRKRPNT